MALASLPVAAGLSVWVAGAGAFGTLNEPRALGQRAEHERITRAALACAPGKSPARHECFQSKTIDQLAGTKGAIGAPDIDYFFDDRPHCTGGDYLAGVRYPISRARATRDLMLCRERARRDFFGAVNAARWMIDAKSELKPKELELACSFIDVRKVRRDVAEYERELSRRRPILTRLAKSTFPGLAEVLQMASYFADHVEEYLPPRETAGSAKCDALEGLGRALHGMQDFYAHSNWADAADPSRPVGVDNPPGLMNAGLVPLLDLSIGDAAARALPTQLSSTCFAYPLDPASCKGRIDHDLHMGKDKGLITPQRPYRGGLLRTSDPLTLRGRVVVGGRSNFDRAVRGAVGESQRAWDTFVAKLVQFEGKKRGLLLACALTHDDPVKACTEEEEEEEGLLETLKINAADLDRLRRNPVQTRTRFSADWTYWFVFEGSFTFTGLDRRLEGVCDWFYCLVGDQPWLPGVGVGASLNCDSSASPSECWFINFFKFEKRGPAISVGFDPGHVYRTKRMKLPIGPVAERFDVLAEGRPMKIRMGSINLVPCVSYPAKCEGELTLKVYGRAP